ncbi:MAG: MGMT family protein [Euryarchaeota archaeon]|nr:MGMT family protein [Euryarchaeota archaeon]
MTGEGVFLEPLGLYFVLERRGGRIRRTRFSRYPPDRPLPQDLSDRILELLRNPAREEEYGLPEDILDLSTLTEFQRAVLGVVASIPWGETMTYGQVAEGLGRHGAARAVGRALAANPVPLIIPCHRVVAVDGIGGYGPGTNLKKMLLDLEANRVDDASSGV